MTTGNPYGQRDYDVQDMVERHVYSDVKYVSGAGSVVKVKGTGTEDDEVPTIVTGYGMRLPKDADAEVMVFGGNSDSNLKFAFVQIPAAKQREWQEGRSGIQNADDPTHALEFRNGELRLTKGTFIVGDGAIQISNGQIYIRGNVTVTGTLTANGGVVTPSVTPGNDPNVPDHQP